MIRKTESFAEISAKADDAFRIAAERVARTSTITDTPILTWDDKTHSIIESAATSHPAEVDRAGGRSP